MKLELEHIKELWIELIDEEVDPILASLIQDSTDMYLLTLIEGLSDLDYSLIDKEVFVNFNSDDIKTETVEKRGNGAFFESNLSELLIGTNQYIYKGSGDGFGPSYAVICLNRLMDLEYEIEQRFNIKVSEHFLEARTFGELLNS